MRITVHAGHNPDGMPGCGAVGLQKESTAAREIVAEIIRLYPSALDITVNNGANSNDVLAKLKEANNAANADLAISVHLNAWTTQEANGVEAYSREATDFATSILRELEDVGYRNRGIKEGDLYILRNFNCPVILVECGFVTSPTDVALYDATKIATAIVNGIGLGRADTPKLYRIQSQPLTYWDAMELADFMTNHDKYCEIMEV